MTPQLQQWIEFLQKPSKAFSGLPPCPFSKASFQNNKVEIIDYVNLLQVIEYMNKPWEKDVVIFVMKNESVHYIEHIALKLSVMYPDFIFLEEHPDLVEEIDGVKMNSGMCMLLVQNRKHLEDARSDLKKTEYYNKWTQELKDRIWNK